MSKEEIEEVEDAGVTADELKELMHSDEFKDAKEEGIKAKKTIQKGYMPEIKECKTEFTDFMLDGLGSKADKETKKEFKKVFAKDYAKLVDLLYYTKGVPKDTSPSKLEELVKQFALASKYFKYMKDQTFEGYLKKYGVSLDEQKTVTLEKEYSHLNPENGKNLASILEDGRSLKGKVWQANDDIVNKIFTANVPLDLQYSKENANGLKASSFKKLINVSLAAEKLQAKNESKLDELKAGLLESTYFNINNEELLQEGYEDIFEQ